MAKKNTSEESNAIGKAQLATGSINIDRSMFDAQDGEVYAGLNILKIEPDTGAGPFVLAKILLNQKLGKDSAAKKRKPVDVYVATPVGAKTEIRMPVAISFVAKAKEAKLAVGDTFLLWRDANYLNKHSGQRNAASYQLKITARAK